MNLREHLKSYYLSESMSADQLAMLLSLARSGEAIKSNRANCDIRSRRRERTYMAVAVLLFIAIPIAYYVGASKLAPSTSSSQSIQAEIVPQASNNNGPIHLMAINMHADWCNRCPLIAPVFDQIERDFSQQPVLFVTFDLTNEFRRRKSERLAEALGIRWLLNEEQRTGIIALVHRNDEKVLAVVSEPNERALLTLAIEDGLSQ